MNSASNPEAYSFVSLFAGRKRTAAEGFKASLSSSFYLIRVNSRNLTSGVSYNNDFNDFTGNLSA
jgi:hypothetical protein